MAAGAARVSGLTYRPEIDGLRAIAVLSVVVYHARFAVDGRNPLAGGFLGVDVFFVISGYLITSIISREMRAGEFTFARFYERRARRLLPALFLVMLVTIPFAFVTLSAQAFREFGKSLIATTLFGSNILFWQTDNYMAVPSMLAPLLHTWSLAVEEQFYLLFPVAMLVCYKLLPNQRNYLLVAGFVASLALAEYGSREFASAAFYLLPMRGWELLAGATVAHLERHYSRTHSSALDNVMSALGLVLIGYSMVAFDEAIRHPGLLTLVPVLGTVLLLWFSGKGGLVSRGLSLRPVVLIGLASYSLYLWHQPVFAIARVAAVYALSYVEKLALIGVCTVLAFASWWTIERPFRKRGVVATSRFVAVVAVCAVLVIGIGLAATGGVLSRAPAGASGVFWEIPKETPWDALTDASGTPCYQRDPGKECLITGDANGPLWISLGDSAAAAISAPLARAIQARKGRFLPGNYGACPFAPGLQVFSGNKLFACGYAIDDYRTKLLQQHPNSIVVLASRLTMYLTGTRFDNKEGGVEPGDGLSFRDRDSKEVSPDYIDNAIRKGIVDLLAAGHKVVLVYPIPEAGWDVPPGLALEAGKQRTEPGRPPALAEDVLSTSYATFLERTARARQLYDSVGTHPQLVRVYPERVFCNRRDSGRCLTHDGRELYYYDSNHLAAAGAQLLVNELMRVVSDKWGL
jgi:peptidoglycan/LPS O-acetylase OafA/YrhL